jgi:hypothetical protein
MLAQMIDDPLEDPIDGPLDDAAATAGAARVEFDAEDRDTVLHELDVVAAAIADVTDGAEEDELLGELRRLRTEARADGGRGESWASVPGDVRVRSAAIVNAFFRERLLAHDRVREIVAELAKG